MNINTTIGAKVKKIREEKNMSVASFAKLLDEKDHRIRDIESGKQKIPPEIITKLRNNLNVNLDWLLTGEGEMYNNTQINHNTGHQIVGNAHNSVIMQHTDIDPELNTICSYVKELEKDERKKVLKFILEL